MAVDQVQYGLEGQLLCVVCPRVTLEDDLFIRVDDAQVPNPTVGGAVDVTFDEPGEVVMIFADPEPSQPYSQSCTSACQTSPSSALRPGDGSSRGIAEPIGGASRSGDDT